MFSPPNSPAVTDWFRRLDAAWKRMPAEEQARQREEVQQHLDGLVAAKLAQGQPPEDAWNAALMQFGDPTQIGCKMYQEWRQSRTGFRADMLAILFGLGLQILGQFVEQVPLITWIISRYFNPINMHHTHLETSWAFPQAIRLIIACGWLVLAGLAIGRKYPLQAIKGAFYATVLWNIWTQIHLAIYISVQHIHTTHPLSVVFADNLPIMILWTLGQVIIAYLASVTKRGWYRPTWADFKLTLPSGRRQISR